MPSFINTQSMASLPSTSAAGTSAASSSNSNEPEQPLTMSLCYEVNALPSDRDTPHSMSAISCEYDMDNSSSNLDVQSNEDIPNGFSGTRSTMSNKSNICFRCVESSPTMRCLECNALFCDDCCHKINSDAQWREHDFYPINQLTPIGVRPNTVNMYCESHDMSMRYYCKECTILICLECKLSSHTEHKHTPIKGAFDICRVDLIKAIESTRIGTKAIQTAIDRANTMSKNYNKECYEANNQIRTTMQLYAQAIETRETYLLDKVERIRQSKINELYQYMNTLRGMLASLSRVGESIIQGIDSDAINLFMIKEKAKHEVNLFSTMYKNMQVKEERISFNSQNFNLVDQLWQCEIQRIYPTSGKVLNSTSHLTLMPMQSLQAGQSYRPSNYGIASTSSTSSAPAYSLSAKFRYYDHTSSLIMQSSISITRSIGQAISGYWNSVSVKPTDSLGLGEPVFSFGREGEQEVEISRPWGLCIDREGNVIVADRCNNCVKIFSKDCEFQTMFGSKGDGPGEFNLPAGITTDIFDRIIVADKDNHRIQIFTMAGKFILEFGSFGKRRGQFQYPWDVAVNTLGNIVVTDTGNHRIQLFTNNGIYIAKYVFDGPSSTTRLNGPTIPRGVSFTTFGNVVVSDFENNRLIMLDPTLSKILHCVQSEGFGSGGLDRPSGIVIDDEGRIIVADSKNYRVVMYTSQLRLLSTVNFKNTELENIDRPTDVALTREGNLVVLFEGKPFADTGCDISSHHSTDSSSCKGYIRVYS